MIVQRAVRGVATLPTGRTGRHAGDAVRVGLGLLVLGLCVLVTRSGQLSDVERDIFRLVNDLPQLLLPVVWTVMQLGNVFALPVLAVAAAAWRRVRFGGDLALAMARDLAVAGGAAYFLARYVKTVVDRGRPADFPVGAVLHEPPLHGLGFVSGHAAVAAALATAAGPYLTRRGRRVCWALAWTVALARVYVGAHLPLDVVGGLALGWVVGSAVHLVFGVPRWTPDAARVSSLLTRYGVPHRDLRPAEVPARSSHPFRAAGADGRELLVKVLDPDPPDEDWIYRLARLVAVRDVKDADALATLGHQADHEAAVALAARQHGVRVPPVLLARHAEGRALVVQEWVDGTALAGLPASGVDPAVLAEVWHQVALLRQARVAHRDLVDSNVVIDAAGRAWIVDFGNAEVGADEQVLAADVAELLAALAVRLDPAAVVRAAVTELGPAAVRAAVPVLQPLALSAATRQRLRAHPGRLPELRAEVRRAVGLPAADPAPALPGPLPWLLVAAGAVAVLVVLPAALDAGSAPGSGWWRWTGGAVLLAVAARFLLAGTVAPAGRRLALGRAAVAGLTGTGAELLAGRWAGLAAALRQLRRAGIPPAGGRAALGRSAAAVLVSRAAAALVAAAWLATGAGASWHRPPLPAGLAVAAAAAVLVAAGQLLARVPPRARDGDRVTRRLRPGRATLPALAAVLVESLVLAAAVEAAGGDLPLPATVGIYLAATLPGELLRPAGGAGLTEGLLVLGLSAAGLSVSQAAAATVLVRLLTYWLPAAAGLLVAVGTHPGRAGPA